MDPNLEQKIKDLEIKANLIYTSVEKTRKYILVMTIITILVVVLPLIGLAFAIPSFISNYTSMIDTLGI